MKFTFEKIKAGGNRYPGNIYYNLKIDRKTTKYIIEFISTYNCFNVFLPKINLIGLNGHQNLLGL